MKAVVFQILISLLIVNVCSCKASTGRRQSPININTLRTLPLRKAGRRQLDIFYNYPPNSTVTVFKDNNTVKFVPERISNDFILYHREDIYVFAELHFHWGTNNSGGTEHTINQMRYSMEAHLVFYKLVYGTKQEAMKQPDGFVVIGLFLQAGGSDNAKFKNVSEIVTQLEAENDSMTATADEAYKWMTDSFKIKSKYYTYPGSLTTPPFSENVQWFVFAFIIPISSEQIQPFRRLTYEGRNLTPNFRELQPLNLRTVYTSHYYNLYT